MIVVNPQVVKTESGDLDSIHLDLTLILSKDNELVVVDNSQSDYKDYVDSDTLFITPVKAMLE